VVGLLLPDTQNPHYLDILAGVEEELIQRDYYLALVITNLNPERERFSLRSLLQQRFDGLILAPIFPDFFEEIAALPERTMPLVFVNKQEGVDCVYADIQDGAGQMMDHLLELGHRRIGLVNGVARRGLAQERADIYTQKHTAAGLEMDSQLIVECGHTIEDGYRAAGLLLAQPAPPTAIWAINDHLAVGVLRAIYERGLKVPADISLAGFDDIALASQLYPPLTTVRNDGNLLGRKAVQMLFQHIEKPDHEILREVIGTCLVVRQSTAQVRAGNT
jgi:LacI family transcriptional regulator